MEMTVNVQDMFAQKNGEIQILPEIIIIPADGTAHIFGDQNQIFLRYAEVLLSRAECKVRTNDIAGAMADLKLVRDRAWGGIAPAIMKDSANYNGIRVRNN